MNNGVQAERLTMRQNIAPILSLLVALATVVDSSSPTMAADPVAGNQATVSRSTGMKFALVRAGGFEMGSLTYEDGHTRNEHQHTVRLTRPFYIGLTEVTQGEYQTVMEVNPSLFRGTEDSSAKLNNADMSQFPVENVSWFDAIEFCNKLSQKDKLKPRYSLVSVERESDSIKAAVVTLVDGDGYRLPTEAEWEYACRAGSTTAYSEGNAASSLGSAGWFGGAKPPGNSRQRPHRVGQKSANDFGLFDMHGNVSEWCQDWYDYYSYDRSPLNDPVGPGGGSERVLRGGSWSDEAVNCRSAYRDARSPAKRSPSTGFRVARSMPVSQVQYKPVAPFRIVLDLRDGGTVDVFNNETYDTIDSAKYRMANSKLFGRIDSIRIIDANGNVVD